MIAKLATVLEAEPAAAAHADAPVGANLTLDTLS
jgi:hypothetical protein